MFGLTESKRVSVLTANNTKGTGGAAHTQGGITAGHYRECHSLQSVILSVQSPVRDQVKGAELDPKLEFGSHILKTEYGILPDTRRAPYAVLGGGGRGRKGKGWCSRM